MSLPNGGLITENNEQYYSGVQKFLSIAGSGQEFITTFDTDLVFGSYNPTDQNYSLNNFKLYVANAGFPTYTEYTSPYTVSGNKIVFTNNLDVNTSIVVQLKTLNGGRYGDKSAYGNTVEKNYGSYSYIKLDDIINNFLVAYVGDGKLIQSCKRTDLVFHAKRAMQEFSYDTLKSINSQELTIPNSLSVIIPQDYVNYVSMSWYDSQGIAHKIYPTTLTTNPYKTPVQDQQGQQTQDSFGNNVQGTSIVEERWNGNSQGSVDSINIDALNNDIRQGYGAVYGLSPQYANSNGWFTINEREGKFSFSSNLVDKLIILEYISDGLASSLDTRVPKLAEEAMYAYISHAVLSGRANQPEYVVNRLKREKSAKLRNAKIRLSNIKPSEIVQVMRGKSKWIKH